MEDVIRDTRQIEKYQKIEILNLVLSPVSNHIPEKYAEYFKSIYDQGIEINTWSDRFIRIKTIHGVGTDNIHGELVSFTKLNPDLPAYNAKTNDLERREYDENIGPNARTAKYYFIPSAHRIVLHHNGKISVMQIMRFLEEAFQNILSPNEDITINSEKTSEDIERIISADGVYTVFVRVSYSNNDNDEDWAAEINEQYQEMGAKIIETNYKCAKNNAMKINKSSIIAGQLELSQSNGFAEAKFMENGKVVKINTADHPRIEQVRYIDDLTTQIRLKVLNLFKRDTKSS